MISPRWRKVINDLRESRLRSALVVLSIAVGVFAVGTVATVNDILTHEMTMAWNAINPNHARFYTSVLDDQTVNAVRRMPEVANAEGRHAITVRFSVGPGQWKDLELTVLPAVGGVDINRVFPESGAWPPPKRAILLERSSQRWTGAAVGETLLVQTPQGKQRRLPVAGSVHDLSQNPPAFSNRAYGYITPETLEWLGYEQGHTQLLIRLASPADDQAAVRRVAGIVEKKLEKGGHTVYGLWIPKPNKHPAEDVIAPMAYIAGSLGLLTLLLAGFLVTNTITAVLTQQIRQIGIMKTIGASNAQIMGLYLGMVLISSLMGLATGIPTATVAGRMIGKYVAGIVNFDLHSMGVPLRVLVLEVVVGMLVPLGAALWPISTGSRVPVLAALSSYGLDKGRSAGDVVDRLLERVRGLSRPLVLSLRNTFRRKGRLALTLTTLTLGGAIFIAVLSVHLSLRLTLEDALEYWNYDVEVRLARPYRIEQLVTAARGAPGVAQVESWGFYGARRVREDGTEGDRLTVVAPPAETTLLRPLLVSGRWLLPADENAVVLNTDALKKEEDVRVGDTVTIKVDDREAPWKVVGIVRGVLTSPIVYMNYSYVSRLVRGSGMASGLQVVGEKHDPISQKQLAKDLEAHLKEAGFRISSTESIGDIRQSVQAQFDIIVIFLLMMAVLLALVGGLGLMGTMSINVLERTREIGVMRAIGASNGALLGIFLTEGIVIGVLSWGLGAIVSLPLSRLLSNTVGTLLLRAPLTYTFSFPGTGLWLVIVTILAALASLLPARNAMRITVRDVLAYE